MLLDSPDYVAPAARTLDDMKIRVGAAHQAELPPLGGGDGSGAYAAGPASERIWAPPATAATDVDAFLGRARGAGSAKAEDDGALLRALYDANYDEGTALAAIAARAGAVRADAAWSDASAEAFASLVEHHGDDLAAIGKELPSISRARVIERFFALFGAARADDVDEAPIGARLSARTGAAAAKLDEKRAADYLRELANALTPPKFAAALGALRLFDQGIVDAKRAGATLRGLLDADRDSDVAAALAYFLPPDDDDSDGSRSPSP